GVIYAPVSGLLYYGAGTQAFVSDNGKPAKQMRVRPAPAEGITVVASKRHGDPERLSDFLKDKKVAHMLNRSSSLKFCVIAAGEADFYPRLGPTSEWDTAAGDAILRAAGGQVTQLCGAPLEYGKADKRFLNPEFVAFAP
ncbi:MAG TPA: inositol monophosphatase family protein, partial [Alphaproteobacteria bacterium]|nr:inositol monophosphatase family protein [Alphaproteobacteria bacterium]